MDIWLKDEKVCGHGSGAEALHSLSRHLNESEGIRYFYLSPSLRNQRAVRAYEKAGFRKLKIKRPEAEKKFGFDVFDYKDNIVMRKTVMKKAESGARMLIN